MFRAARGNADPEKVRSFVLARCCIGLRVVGGVKEVVAV